MEIFGNSAEIWKGVTNLPILVISFIFFILLKRKMSDRKSIYLFLFLSVDAILGSAVHIFAFPTVIFRILWIILYFFMYETMRLAFLILMTYGDKENGFVARVAKPMIITELICMGLSIGCVAFGNYVIDIYFLGLFALLVFIPIVYMAIIGRKKAGKLFVLTLFLLGALAFELIKDILPPAVGVVMCHIFITLSLYYLYRIAE